MKRGQSSSKSRSGCQTCKSRKIKCDETEPACKACLRSRLVCPGYSRPLKWSRKHEVHISAPSSSLRSNRLENALSSDYSASGNPLEIARQSSSARSPVMSSLSEWPSLEFDGVDIELALQDAAVLASQDPTAVTASFMYPTFPSLEASMPTVGPLSEQPSESLSVMTGSSEYTSTSNLVRNGNTLASQESIIASKGHEDDNNQEDVHRADPQEDSHGSCALLQTFYRLSSPQSFRRPPDEEFVRYYFKHVCRLHSCFDSDMNYFRSLATKWWSTCRTVSLILQSMAIAHIANWYPYMAPLGISKRYQAWQSLQKDLHLQRLGRLELNKLLLCLFLLGISASWQQVSHLGLPYLHIARNLTQNKLRQRTLKTETDGLDDFWASALVYWEMLASIVDPVAITVFDAHGLPELRAQTLRGRITPHPWNGVATELQFVLAEIVRVSRRRHRCPDTTKVCPEEQSPRDLDHGWLQNLEQLLLTITIPDQAHISPFEDPLTSELDLIRTAEAYRGVAFLEIYRLCSGLLYKRLEHGDPDKPLLFDVPDEHSAYAKETDSYLSHMAVCTTNLMAQIPISSGVCRAQPLLMVACANQLRLPDRLEALSSTESAARHHDILQSRAFVESRVLALSRTLPQAPILRTMEIINEVWDRLDGARDVYWMDVLHEKGWQTILG